MDGATAVIIMEHSDDSRNNNPITLATVPQVRGTPMMQDPKLNSHSKLNCILACIQAEKAGADEALMLDPLGFVNTTKVITPDTMENFAYGLSTTVTKPTTGELSVKMRFRINGNMIITIDKY